MRASKAIDVARSLNAGDSAGASVKKIVTFNRDCITRTAAVASVAVCVIIAFSDATCKLCTFTKTEQL